MHAGKSRAWGEADAGRIQVQRLEPLSYLTAGGAVLRAALQAGHDARVQPHEALRDDGRRDHQVTPVWREPASQVQLLMQSHVRVYGLGRTGLRLR